MKRLILLIGLICLVQMQALAACTSGTCYVSPSGSGTTCSSGSPCTVAQALATVAAGDTIWMQDGTYTGANGMLNAGVTAANIDGTAVSRISVKAVNDGAVLIDGESARLPIQLGNGTDHNNYWTIEGVNAANADSGSDSVIRVRSSTGVEIKRVCGWNAEGTANASVINLYAATNTLLEDICFFGTGRKGLVAYGATTGTTIRRAWGQFEYSTRADPKETLSMFYDATHTLVENALLTWGERAMTNTTEMQGMLTHDQTTSMDREVFASVYGSIIYLPSGKTFTAPDFILFNSNDEIHLTNVAVFVPSDQSSKVPVYWTNCHTTDSSGVDCTSPTPNLTATNMSVIGGTTSTWGSQIVKTNVDTASSVAGVYTGANTIWVNDGTTGATVCYRYVDGTLSSTPLWPWPMNQRIIDAMTAASETPIDVTAAMESIFGTIPADCRGGSPTFPLTLITHTSAGSSDQSNVTTSGVDTTGADLLTMEVAIYNDLPICTPSDSKSNTWTGLTAYGVATDQRVRIYYSPHPTVGASHTFTCNGTSLAPSIAVQAWSGSATVPFDVQNGSTDTNVTGVRPGNVTPTVDGTLIVTAVSAAPITGALSIDSSFTKVDEVNFASGSHYGLSVGYKLVATPAVNNPLWTGDATLNNWATDIAVFKSGTTYAGPAPSVFNSPVFRPRVFFSKN